MDVNAPTRLFHFGRIAPPLSGHGLAREHFLGQGHIHPGPVHPRIAGAAHPQHRVADFLGGQPAHFESGEQVVRRIRFQGFGRRRGRGLIGLRGQDQTVQPLETPAVLNEMPGQPIEQFGMGGSGSLDSEVARRAHQTAAEVMLEYPIDDHPCGERVVGCSDPVGQGPASTGGTP